MPTWPATVPFIEAEDGFSESHQPQDLLRTSMSWGPAKTRRRSSSSPTDMSGKTGLMNQTQYLALNNFFVQDVKKGSLDFNATHPLTGATHTFKFKAPPRLTIKGLRYSVTLELEYW